MLEWKNYAGLNPMDSVPFYNNDWKLYKLATTQLKDNTSIQFTRHDNVNLNTHKR